MERGMQAPAEWATRAAVVAAPWALPDRASQYRTLLDAVIAADHDSAELAPWIVLEDGRMLNPRRVAALRESIAAGSLSLPVDFEDF
jgi:hypothetical protein